MTGQVANRPMPNGMRRLNNGETCWPAGAIRDARRTIWAAPPGCGSDRPASFSHNGPQAFHLVPVKLVQVQHQAALAPRQRIADALPQLLGIRLRERAFQPHPDLLLRMLQLDLHREVRTGNLGVKFLPQIKRTPALFRQAIRRSLQFGMLETDRTSTSPRSTSAAPTARTDLNRWANAGRPSSA